MKDYSRYSSITSMIKKLKWSSLLERRTKLKTMMMYRIVKKKVAIKPEEVLTPLTSHSRGNTKKYLLPYARTQVYQHSFFPSAIRIWNKIPPQIANIKTVDSFKAAIDKTCLSTL